MIENVYSYRLRLEYKNNNEIDVILRCNNKSIGYIKEIIDNNDLIIEFDINKDEMKKGYQTEALREYLRYKYLWEKKCDVIKCYPKLVDTINVLNKRYFIKEKNYYIINKEIYMKHVEKLSLYDKNLNLLDYPNLRGEKIEKDTFPGIVDILVFNIKNNKYLTTRRDINKVTSPGLWEWTGGGIDYKEDKTQALVREVKEETGLDIIKYEYVDHSFIKDLVYFSYVGYVECKDDDVVLQKGETIDYKWRSYDELKELYKTDLVPSGQKIRFEKYIKFIERK